MYRLKTLQRAEVDIDKMYHWMAKRSPGGAGRWFRAFLVAAESLKTDADRYALASEAPFVGMDVREHFFRTPRGRNYRIIYVIVGEEVRILRVRGPGQAPLHRKDVIY